ncbi:YgjV family protein [Aliiglaciecola lipolytica]|nr:YgjV family protein [Aliiglaciecola lipolytica]
MSFPEFNLVQGIGMLSFVLGIVCFYQQNDRKLKVMLLLLNFNHAIHFALLGAETACLSAVLAIVRTAISLKTASKKIAFTFIFITFFWGLHLTDNWYDMFPILGSCIGTYAIFCLQGIVMRLGLLIGALCWLTNNIIVGSIGTTLLELTIIAVNLRTIYQLFRSR